MIKTLNNTIKQDRTAYKIPRSVQDIIPIQRIFADGIFQFGTKYSRTLRFSDINYAIASKEDKTAMFLGYSELLNALDSGSTTKLTICNKQVGRQAFEDTVLLPQRGDSLDGFVDEFNGMLEGKISGSSASVEQERFITVSVHKKNVDEARTFFSRVTGEITSKLSRLNSSSIELDAAERLDVLRGFFRPEETALPFDLQSAMRRGHNLKDTICPDSLEFHRDYFKMGSHYGRVLFLKDYASYIKDSMILELTDLNRRMMLSIDMIPVPTDEAVREVENKLLGVETNVTNWQRRQNNNQNFSAVVPYDLEQQRKETREMLDDLTTRDQRMLFAVVTLVHLADSKEELDSDTETLQSIARKHLCQLAKLSFQQQDGLITVEEEALHGAVVCALNRFHAEDESTYLTLMKATIGEAIGINGGSEEIDLLTRRIDTLNKRMLDLVNETVAAGKDVESSEDEFKSISDQIEQLNRRIAAIQESIHKDGSRQARLEEIQSIIAERNANETQYDDSIVRQMIECIKVHNDGKLTIIFGGGYEIEETL